MCSIIPELIPELSTNGGFKVSAHITRVANSDFSQLRHVCKPAKPRQYTSASSIGPLVRLPRCKFSPVLPNSGAGCPPKPRFSRSTVLRIEWITFDWSYLLSLANPETRKVEEIWRTASYNKSGAPAPVNDLELLRCLAVSHPSVCTMIHRNIVDFIHGY